MLRVLLLTFRCIMSDDTQSKGFALQAGGIFLRKS